MIPILRALNQLIQLTRTPPPILEPSENIYQERFHTISKILSYIIANPENWDNSCQMSIAQWGAGLLQDLTLITSSEENVQKQGIDKSYARLLYILLEFQHNVSGNNALNPDLDN